MVVGYCVCVVAVCRPIRRVVRGGLLIHEYLTHSAIDVTMEILLYVKTVNLTVNESYTSLLDLMHA